ncbi:7414_t:CDS:2 [Acaulospora morrowiae]|uniref:7414_t:CDS:1 n=1 Tax=Acaulospora morrowiae TaxID=94023 RepID=A0A9N9F4F8_9GLOM|nr:7414_t:CDS:2 [Acaulospora morrowiae]
MNDFLVDTVDPIMVNDDYEESLDENHEEEEDLNPLSININYQPEVKTHFCCQIDRDIHTEDSKIFITAAQKANDPNGSSYITYTIRVEDQEVNRRYSEFESLRKSLMRLYPTLIIPPIPEKHSIADYATMQNKAKEDAVIGKRKRMLQSFLNRLSNHPQLSNEHVFHRFMENGVPWNEVLHSPPLSNLPKNILQGSPANLSSQNNTPTSTTNSSIPPAVLPTPSASQQLRVPDPLFVESEAFTNKFYTHISQNMEKTNKRIWKRLNDFSNDYSELGALYNGFSLNENGDLAIAIEKVGQAVDSTYIATRALTDSLEAEFTEPLQEYSQFAQVIKQVLKYRYLKHLQMELTAETLEKQRFSLDNLEKSEQEAKRLEEALNKERETQDTSSHQNHADDDNHSDTTVRENGHHEGLQNGDSSVGYKTHHKKRSSSKLFSVLSHTIHGIMDVDPEATRRNSIGKTRESIIQLEEALETTKADLKNISISIQNDLNRFQRQKISDIRQILIDYAKNHVKWCQKNLNSWEEAKAEIEKVQT